MVKEDPEVFEIYYRLAQSARVIVDDHIARLEKQIRTMIEDGIKAGEFASSLNVRIVSTAFYHAISKFLHPALVQQKPVPTRAQADAVLGLLITGLVHGS